MYPSTRDVLHFLIPCISRHNEVATLKSKFFVPKEIQETLGRWNKIYFHRFTLLKDQICTFLYNCAKSVQIRSFLWSVFSCIRTEYGKILYLSIFSPNRRKYRPGKTPYLDTFHAVYTCLCNQFPDQLIKNNKWVAMYSSGGNIFFVVFDEKCMVSVAFIHLTIPTHLASFKTSCH